MDAKINEIPCFFEKGGNTRNYCIYNRKRGSGRTKRDQKSILNVCKIDAGKRHAKKMENDTNMEQIWEPKSVQNRKKEEKTHAEIDAKI